MRVVSPRRSPAAGRGVLLAAGLGVLAGVCCAGWSALLWQWLDRVVTLP